MPVLVDPESALPPKHKLTPAQVIMLLLYPVIFVVGLAVGLVIGLKQGKLQAENAANQVNRIPTSIIPNANSVVTTNTVNGNTNSLFQNGNSALNGGDFLEIDATTQAQLNSQEQQDKETKVDQTTSLTDIVRQQDLITLQYRLKAYFTVNALYPSTSGQQIRLDRSSADVFYQALKDFYGGSFNEPIDPEHPTRYYGYTSDGTGYELTAWLVSQNQAFILSE